MADLKAQLAKADAQTLQQSQSAESQANQDQSKLDTLQK